MADARRIVQGSKRGFGAYSCFRLDCGLNQRQRFTGKAIGSAASPRPEAIISVITGNYTL